MNKIKSYRYLYPMPAKTKAKQAKIAAKQAAPAPPKAPAAKPVKTASTKTAANTPKRT